MADFGLVRESVKGLGAGAYLVNALPSAVLVLGSLAMVASRLYPWMHPMTSAAGKAIPAGVPSVAAAIRHLGVSGGILLALAILIATVALRPFQISMVQALEGYWKSRFWLSPIEAIATERHARRYSVNMARGLRFPQLEVPPTFQEIAAQARRESREDRRVCDAEEALGQYPDSVDLIMPTLLGNILRRAETTSGERYGLETVLTFPRLYPYLSPRLQQESETQLNVLDTSATLTIIFGTLSILASPFVCRLDGWSLLPIGLATMGMLSYRGARLAAGRHGVLLASAYDLHRFDMLLAMHRHLPANVNDEREDNQVLCQLLRGEPPQEPVPDRWNYVHPSPVPADSAQALPDTATSSNDQADGST